MAAAIAGIILVLTVTILIILVWKTWSKRKAAKAKKDDPYYTYIPRATRAVDVDGVRFVPYESILSLDLRGAFPDSIATAAPAAVNQCIHCSSQIDEPQQLGDDPEITTISMVRNKAYTGSGATGSTVACVGTSNGETEDNVQDETAEVNYVSMIRNSAYGSFDSSDGGASVDTGIDMDTENCVEASACVDAGSDMDMKMVENAAYRIDISIDAPAHSGVFIKSKSLNRDERIAGIVEREGALSR